tara:strand:- start:887 stop:1159 length:273 start_codon:yes stop_codon:yes gene_type:complete
MTKTQMIAKYRKQHKNTYIDNRIKDKIDSRILSYQNRLNYLFKTRNDDLYIYDKKTRIELIKFTIRNLKVWIEINKRNDYYKKRVQKQKK